MIGTINNLMSKVFGTVTPYVVGTDTSKGKKAVKAAKSARKAGKSKTGKRKGSCRKCRC